MTLMTPTLIPTRLSLAISLPMASDTGNRAKTKTPITAVQTMSMVPDDKVNANKLAADGRHRVKDSPEG